MKFIFHLAAFINALFLCCCTPGCTLSDEKTCSAGKNNDWQGMPWPEDETELDKACRGDMISTVNCFIEFGERCPDSYSAKFLKSNKEHIELYNNLCSTGNVLREQFVRNVGCLNEKSLTINEECQPKEKEESVKKCTYDEAVLECVKEKLAVKCGTESVNVFNELMKPLISLSDVLCNIIAMMK